MNNYSSSSNGTSAIHDMEMSRLDQEIEKTRKQFYATLLGKKRRVKRKWLEISAMTNAHLLQTLPYRAMLGHVAKIAEERDKIIAEITTSDLSSDNSSIQQSDKPDKEIHDEKVVQVVDEKEQYDKNPRLARDEAIQTDESSFLTDVTHR